MVYSEEQTRMLNLKKDESKSIDGARVLVIANLSFDDTALEDVMFEMMGMMIIFNQVYETWLQLRECACYFVTTKLETL